MDMAKEKEKAEGVLKETPNGGISIIGLMWFAFVLLLSVISVCIYGVLFDKIGPADETQNTAYIVFFIINIGIFIECVYCIAVVKTRTTNTGIIAGLHGILSSCLLLSMLGVMLYNFSPDGVTVSKSLRNNLAKRGSPTNFMDYLQKNARCCGAIGLEDYFRQPSTVLTYPIPNSCCVSAAECSPTNFNTTWYYPKGCFTLHSMGKLHWEYNNPELKSQMMMIRTVPFLHVILCLSTLFLFSYYHCWKMYFENPACQKPNAVSATITVTFENKDIVVKVEAPNEINEQLVPDLNDTLSAEKESRCFNLL